MICPNCKSIFIPKRSDSTYCSRKCIYKVFNDKRPRKTSKSYIKANLLRNKSIPSLEKEIIMGTLMGDASLILQTNNFHRLSLCHSDKQKEYIEFKKNLLPSIFIQKNLNRYKHKSGSIQWHTHSISHKELTNIYGLFYRKHKFITRKLLNQLTQTSLLFWYLDDGSIIKASGNTIVLCTDSFSISEVKTIKQWFWQQWKIETNILQVKGGFSDKQYYRLRLTKEPTNRFIEVISQSPLFNSVPQSMYYKLLKN